MINDDKFNRLEISGYTDGTVTDRWVDYLKTSTAWQAGDPEQTNDLLGLWLEQQGAIGSTINNMWYDYLDTAGYNLSDALPDRLYDFWSDPAVLP